MCSTRGNLIIHCHKNSVGKNIRRGGQYIIGDLLISGEEATLAGCYRPGLVQSLCPGVQMSAQDGS